MMYLALLCIFPFVWPFVAKHLPFFQDEISWIEVAINWFGGILIVAGIWYAGMWSAMVDTEIWNGKVANKKIEDGYYQTSSCNSTDKDGNCTSYTYYDHYTRDWTVYGSFGGAYEVVYHHYRESSSKRTRNNFPEPGRYTVARVGEPAAIEMKYENYVQAAPGSLFNVKAMASDREVPAYPRVHDHYRINRVIGDGRVVVNDVLVNDLNNRLNEALIRLGPRKQVNIVVVLTRHDATYRYDVENAWLGGEKNDAVVFIGVDVAGLTADGETLIPKIVWADVMTFAHNQGNELFNITMRDELEKIGTWDATRIADTITTVVRKKFDRIPMSEFEYLRNQITPANWVIAVAAAMSVIGSVALSFVMAVVEID